MKSAQKVEAIIRQKQGYEKLKVKDLANNIFLTGDLNRDYFGSKDKENFDWESLTRKYEGKLRPEFIRENILNARVQALAVLKESDERFFGRTTSSITLNCLRDMDGIPQAHLSMPISSTILHLPEYFIIVQINTK